MWGEILDLQSEGGVVPFHPSHSTLRWSEDSPGDGGNWHSSLLRAGFEVARGP